MPSLLIDVRDVLADPIPGDTITLVAPRPRPSADGGVVRPFRRIIELTDGRATVDVEPGPLNVIMHEAPGRQINIHTTVPNDKPVYTLRELIMADVGTIDDVPGIRDALDSKADAASLRALAAALDDLAEALKDKAEKVHGHTMADVENLTSTLDNKAPKVHGHTINEIADLRWSLDQKVNTYDLEQTVYDFAAARIAEIVDGAPESLDTLREVAEALANQDDSIKAILEAVGARAMKSHKHDVADVNGLQTALDGKAASPVIFARDTERWSIVGRTPEDWSFWGLGRLYLPPGSYFVVGTKVENLELRSDKADVPNLSVTLPGVVTVAADKSYLLPLAPLQNDSALLVLPAAV